MLCDDSTHKILILQCYCISYNENETWLSLETACMRASVNE